MWRAFQRYRALNPEARKLFWRAALLLPQIAICLRLRGFKRTLEALQKSPPPAEPAQTKNPTTAEAVQMTCRMTKAAVRYGLIRPTCLVESLALWYLLETQEIPVSLRIGVKTTDKFEAHAWVEYAGAALNQTEQQHQHYAVFDNAFSDLPGEKP
jgi:Transglutaminase-like superfamily